ncbi:hypothetical protein LZ32DRAFT_607880 [Colletotrichum eremochloae]|nr:hypothetical protein LZ32DRAFT_607880 [Colletotrichum eremochloae]
MDAFAPETSFYYDGSISCGTSNILVMRADTRIAGPIQTDTGTRAVSLNDAINHYLARGHYVRRSGRRRQSDNGGHDNEE